MLLPSMLDFDIGVASYLLPCSDSLNNEREVVMVV